MADCCARVSVRGMNMLRDKSCERPACVRVDGKDYCRVHTPSAVESRKFMKEKRAEELFEERRIIAEDTRNGGLVRVIATRSGKSPDEMITKWLAEVGL